MRFIKTELVVVTHFCFLSSVVVRFVCLHFRSKWVSYLLPVLVLDLGHGESLEVAPLGLLLELLEFLLAQMVYETSSDRVTEDVDGRPEPAKQSHGGRISQRFWGFGFTCRAASRRPR